MKKFMIFAVVVLFAGVVLYVSQRSENINTASYDAGHLDWCDSIYHQNVGCPKHGRVEIPPAVLARQEADHLAWCESICHQVVALLTGVEFYVSQRSENINTASYDAGDLDWCDSIYHQNVGCPKHGRVEIPPAVLARQEADHLAWCDRINHRNVGCPYYRR